MKPLLCDSRFLNNAIYILDGLNSSDMQTARRLYEELLDLRYSEDTPIIKYLTVYRRDDLFRALGEIYGECTIGCKPIIHIEAHGDKEDGILLRDPTSRVSWIELVNELRSINVATKNHTGLVLAACNGLYAIRPIKDLNSPTPFYFLIGSDGKVGANEIDEHMKIFYKKLIQSNSLTEAMIELEESFQLFLAEKYFLLTMARYFKNGCVGRGKRERVERLVTELRKDDSSINRYTLRAQRKFLKQAVRPSIALYNQYAQSFLLRSCNVSFVDVHNFIKGKN